MKPVPMSDLSSLSEISFPFNEIASWDSSVECYYSFDKIDVIAKNYWLINYYIGHRYNLWKILWRIGKNSTARFEDPSHGQTVHYEKEH